MTFPVFRSTASEPFDGACMSRWKMFVFLSTRIAVTNRTLPLASEPSMTIAPVFCSTMPCQRVMPSFFCVAEEAFACMTTPVTTFAVVGSGGGAGAAQPMPAPAVTARQVTSIMQRLRNDIEILPDQILSGSSGAREAELSSDNATRRESRGVKASRRRSVTRLHAGHRQCSSPRIHVPVGSGAVVNLQQAVTSWCTRRAAQPWMLILREYRKTLSFRG